MATLSCIHFLTPLLCKKGKKTQGLPLSSTTVEWLRGYKAVAKLAFVMNAKGTVLYSKWSITQSIVLLKTGVAEGELCLASVARWGSGGRGGRERGWGGSVAQLLRLPQFKLLVTSFSILCIYIWHLCDEAQKDLPPSPDFFSVWPTARIDWLSRGVREPRQP